MSCNFQPSSSAIMIDRDAFKQVLKLPALRVPKAKCHYFMKLFRGYTLEKPKLKCVVPDSKSEDTRLLLLDLKVSSSGLSSELQDVVAREQLEMESYEVTLDYSHVSAEQVLRTLLPQGVDPPSSFETVGHIAHLNLRTEQLQYKELIGQVLLDKNPHIKTVVNKIGSIENEYRVFNMELLAGEPRLETEVVQHGAKFKLDFSQVYWNSRLESEHKRLVSLFEPSQVVVDVMAGIGPFAVPAALRGCTVYANDLNPASVKYMRTNVSLNKVSNKVHVFKMDGRRFIRMMAGCEDGEISEPPLFHHVVMNLPASAIEFLDAFRGAFDPLRWRGQLPTVHVYTFKKGVETETDILSKAESYMERKFDEAPQIHTVRDVAPNKLMLCLSFRVPESVAFHGRLEVLGSGEADMPSSVNEAEGLEIPREEVQVDDVASIALEREQDPATSGCLGHTERRGTRVQPVPESAYGGSEHGAVGNEERARLTGSISSGNRGNEVGSGCGTIPSGLSSADANITKRQKTDL